MRQCENKIQKINTTLGELTIEQDNNFPNRITIFLDNSPIMMLDGEAPEYENKFVFKRYTHKNVIHNDDYINKSVYQIKEEELTSETVAYILKSLEENNDEKRNS